MFWLALQVVDNWKLLKLEKFLNICHTKGTVHFWSKISGRFYWRRTLLPRQYHINSILFSSLTRRQFKLVIFAVYECLVVCARLHLFVIQFEIKPCGVLFVAFIWNVTYSSTEERIRVTGTKIHRKRENNTLWRFQNTDGIGVAVTAVIITSRVHVKDTTVVVISQWTIFWYQIKLLCSNYIK